MLLGHWGRTPGQNFIYVHLNRAIKKYDLDMIYVSGPRHGGPAVVGNTYLEGTYSEIYPNISQDEAGLRKLFLQFSERARLMTEIKYAQNHIRAFGQLGRRYRPPLGSSTGMGAYGAPLRRFSMRL